jgi:hypothetical protein
MEHAPWRFDHWLVMTVGVLITSIALALLVAARRRQSSPEIAVLAMASALGLTLIDVIYVRTGQGAGKGHAQTLEAQMGEYAWRGPNAPRRCR